MSLINDTWPSVLADVQLRNETRQNKMRLKKPKGWHWKKKRLWGDLVTALGT